MRSSRRNRPSLIGTAARTAVVVGTATAVSGAVAGSQQQKAAAKQAQAAGAQQQALAEQQAALAQQQAELEAAQTAAAPAPAAGLTDETIAQLKQIGELHQAGILSDEEFAATKTRLLGL
ncbi:MAG: SHOCT domain-containing protein [Anaerolineae bacterium]